MVEFSPYFHLKKVSRSFYLNTMVLPRPLRGQVAVAYLFCRILDTIEDCPQLSVVAQQQLMDYFFLVLENPHHPANAWAQLITPLNATASEKLLLADFPLLAQVFWHWNTSTQKILIDHIKIMGAGMLRFCQRRQDCGPHFLTDWQQFDDYCYVVAGVVGELLTALFTQHWHLGLKHQQQLTKEEISFGQALQSTNIIKDFFSDYQRGICFWPALPPNPAAPEVQAMLYILIARSIPSFRAAENYLRQLPWRAWRGKIFCLWPLLFALATLTKILQKQQDFLSGKVIKITHFQVKLIIYSTFLSLPFPWIWNLLLFIYRAKLQQELALWQEQN